MKITYNKKTEHYLTVDNITFQIPYADPIVEHTIVEKTPVGYLLGILYRDNEPNYDMFKNEDGNGKILSFHRNASTEERRQAHIAIGYYANTEDPYNRISAAPIFRILSCYSHGNAQWGLQREVYQCQWDTAKVAGVWIPDKTATENIELLTADMSDTDRKLRIDEYVRGILKEYNARNNGEVYGISICEYVIQDNRALAVELKLVKEDTCWNFVGAEYTIAEMREQINARLKQ